MPEIGNVLFDQCGGGYEIERGAGFEDQLHRLFEAVDPERDTSWRDYGPSFENATFQIWPYSWCDCDCGYATIEAEWSKRNGHKEVCYQALSAKALREWELMNDYEAIEEASYCDIHTEETSEFMGMSVKSFSSNRSAEAEKAHKRWCSLYDSRRKEENRIHEELCIQFGIDWNDGYGSACHCTCDFDKLWKIFLESHSHDPRCQVARKSFLFKPSGFWMDWYKYPLRDAHANQPITVGEFSAIVDACISSLAQDKGGPVITLEKMVQQ